MTVSRRGDLHHSQFEPAKAVVILMSLVDASYGGQSQRRAFTIERKLPKLMHPPRLQRGRIDRGGDTSEAWDTIPKPNNGRLLTRTDVKLL